MEEEEKRIEQASGGLGKEIPLSVGERKALLRSLRDAEGMIRHDKGRETVVVFDREGVGFFAKRQQGQVVNMEQEVRQNKARFEGATLTHNHPGGTSFSPSDIDMACWARLAEMRIVSTNYDYSFSKHDGNMSEEWWKTEITPYVDAARQSARLLLAEVGVNEESEDFPFLYVHEAYRHLARITDFVYTKIDRRKRGDTL